ncbi:MAG TPA: hypothetical protein VG942_19480 [Hyphomonadaceae bacterium]|nr:hypothetical protein [Hyphomonadaceae bacterium]
MAALAACQTAPAALSNPVRDVSFIGGCWEQHREGRADFLRLLPNHNDPGGFSGYQTTFRDNQITYRRFWTFASGGASAEWVSAIGVGDEGSSYVPATNLPAKESLTAPGEKAAFFWERPGEIFFKISRQSDVLRFESQSVKGAPERYSSAGGVLFEGKLSGCD